MSNIKKLYENYYREQSPESIDELFFGLLDYDHSGYFRDMKEILRISRDSKKLEASTKLHSNGSTGGDNEYLFSPHFHHWASRLEPFLRNMEDGKTIFLYCRIGNGTPPRKLYISEARGNKKHYETNANFLDDRQILELFDFVDRLHEEFGKVNFSSFPDIWNMLFSNPLFNQMCLNRKNKIGCFVNSDFEMFFGTDDFWVRDQMINWRSGLNFFTCPFGKKHFLPTFIEDEGCSSLINAMGEKDDSDEISMFEKATMCECGKSHIPLEILFHKDNSILGPDGKPIDFTPLKRSLSGRYATIQFHQNNDGDVKVFLTPTGDIGEDTDKIKCFFSGLKTEFRLNRYFEVGSKRYCFWKSDSVEEKEFRLKED